MKRILVIGGSGYIGQAIVQELLQDSNNEVLWTYCKNPLPLELDRQEKISCDISSPEDIQKLLERVKAKWAGVDGVVFAAAHSVRSLFFKNDSVSGINYKRSWEQDSFEEEKKLINFYTLHLLEVLRPFIGLLKTTKNPNIVFIGSLVGLKGVPAPVSLSLAKSSLRGVVESLAKDLGEFNIKVNSVDPGILEGGQALFLSSKIKQDYLKHVSLKRFGTAEEVSKVVAWLILHNTFITSKAILLDGGL